MESLEVHAKKKKNPPQKPPIEVVWNTTVYQRKERQSRNIKANQMGEELHSMKNGHDVAASAQIGEFFSSKS